MKFTTSKIVVAGAMCALFSAAVAADEPQPLPAATQEAKNPLGAKLVDVDSLAKQRGGTDPGTLNDMKLNGVVSNNSASNLTTGNNTITDGAFANLTGIPLVVQNSGNNVLIQNATIINVQIK